MKNVLIVVIIVLLLAGGSAFYFFNKSSDETYTKDPEETNTNIPEDNVNVVEETPIDILEPTENNNQNRGPETIIGKSVAGNDIKAYHFGQGENEILFVGGIHGGYSWNTALVAFEMIDWLKDNPNAIPENVTVTVIPVLNPDGLEKVTGTTGKFSASQVSSQNRTEGRFNANNVDLNRNFDCEWQPVGTWQDREVSGGKTAFSEPESKAIRDYVNNYNPVAAVTWYSAAGGVYASSCRNGISSDTLALTNLYAKASGYQAFEEFDYYEITGDMVNWFASKNIPAISVLLTTHEQTEWTKNKAGIEAVIKHYANN
ncbi:MAG: M14 family metallopeptidase [Candidatus Paceibacterota bacterium]